MRYKWDDFERGYQRLAPWMRMVGIIWLLVAAAIIIMEVIE